MDHKCHCAFDLLLSISVPHVLEKIFFSLDYESFKNCQEVCNGWKKSLTSERFQRKASQVYFYRVTLVVEYLGWVDLDLGCSTILLGQ